MNQNVKIAKKLVKLAKSLMAINIDKNYDEPIYWNVWYLDTWGNEEDGWQVNDRREIGTFECYSDNEKDIQQAFEQFIKKNGYKVIPFEYDWLSEDNCGVNDAVTGEYLFEFEASKI